MFDSREYYKKNKERIDTYRKEWKSKNREHVLEMARIASRRWRLANQEKVKRDRYATRDRLRMDVLNAYGHECQCCGINNKEFLAMDHINGGGNAHRRSLHPNASAQTLYTWLRKNNYPKEFQILCHNCNSAKAYYGGCPHKNI